MPDHKSQGVAKRIEQVLDEQRPLYISALALFLQGFFFVYDAVVYLPFKIFADPEKKLARSAAIKAAPIVEKDNRAPWRNVSVLNTKLESQIYPGIGTLGDIWTHAVELHREKDCMGWRTVQQVFEEQQPDGRKFQKLVLGDYQWLSYKTSDGIVKDIAAGFNCLGCSKGDKVVIFAETRKEWLVTALACFSLGLPVVTVYATLGEEAVAFAIKECDAVAVVTVRALLPKLPAALREAISIRTVVYFEDLYCDESDEISISEVVENEFKELGRALVSLADLRNLYPREIGAKAITDAKISPEDLAMIMYTSGTTGNPKGVMLSHKNIIAALAGQSAVIPVDTRDTVIGYLPLAHILEVCAELVCLAKGCRVGYSSALTLFDRAAKIQKGSKGDCAALEPTLMACVPAVMDRIFKAVSDEVRQSSCIARELFRICYERKRARYEEGYKSLVMDRLAFDRIRQLLGGKLRIVLSGGAPLNPETQRFMNICFCCPVVQGYGLTETCGGGSLADVHDLSTGSVGPPLVCCEILLREWAEAGYSPDNKTPQGEILIHGDNVGIGYFKNEEKTNEDFVTVDGKRYFATGDIGEFRKDGSLRIIDRKKDLIKLAHGEYISLGKIETTLLTNAYVDNICVYGNSHRDYLVALVVPNDKNVRELIKTKKIDITDWKDICRNKDVIALVGKELMAHGKGKLQRAEIPQKYFLCEEPWTAASGLLTEALKLKRKNIEKAFSKEISVLYE